MAVSRVQRQITFSAAITSTLSALSSVQSDSISPSDSELVSSYTIKGGNSGLPMASDYVDVYFYSTFGDPDSETDETPEYQSQLNRDYVGRIDLSVNVVDIFTHSFDSSNILSYKFEFVSNASSNTLVISASGQGTVFS